MTWSLFTFVRLLIKWQYKCYNAEKKVRLDTETRKKPFNTSPMNPSRNKKNAFVLTDSQFLL